MAVENGATDVAPRSPEQTIIVNSIVSRFANKSLVNDYAQICGAVLIFQCLAKCSTGPMDFKGLYLVARWVMFKMTHVMPNTSRYSSSIMGSSRLNVGAYYATTNSSGIVFGICYVRTNPLGKYLGFTNPLAEDVSSG